MFTRKNKIFILFTLLVLFAALLPNQSHAQPNKGIAVILNGERLNFDVNPIIVNGRTMVPFRKIGESMGAAVSWNGETRTVFGSKEATYIRLKLDSKSAYVNEREVNLDVPAMIKQGRTLVPLRFFSEAFGANVDWDQDTYTVHITTGSLKKHILGFYYSKSYGDFQRNLNNLSSTAYKWYTLDYSGNLSTNDTSKHIYVPEGYEDALELAKANGIHSYALVFESNPDVLHNVLSNDERRSDLIDQIMDLVQTVGFDGVNIDFEYVREGDKEYLNTFMKDLHHKMSSKGKILSISLHSKTEKADWFKGYDYETLGKNSDFVVLMGYDKNPAVAGPQAPIKWVEDVVDYALNRIPAEKIVLGIGVYGYGWTDTGTRTTWLHARNEVDYRIRFINETIRDYNIQPQWDEESAMAHFTFTDYDGVTHNVWYENEKSIEEKLELVKRKNLKGIAFWRLGYTTPEIWDTVNRVFGPVKYY